MAAFVEAVERASFSAAAKTLKLTPSALSKLVARLEARLGVSLMKRTTRRLSLTPEGEAYFERARRIVEDIRSAESEVAGFRERPRGLLRINCGNAFGIHQLVPTLPEFVQRFPDLKIELSLDDKRVDLIESGADLAIRVGHVVDEQLVARKICDLRRMICAAPSYLARRGTPRKPEDLVRHECITMAGMPNLARWPFRSGTVTVSGSATADSANAVMEMGLRGMGIIRFADFAFAQYVREGRLIPVLVDHHKVDTVPISVVYPQSKHRVPKTAAFVDFMLRRFAHAPWRVD
ncbi:MAG: LysR family transcriptional regulator [Proteobacteria bacterium]|nr:LysR family transcriptional regulator [Pseudomonadota bacterium]